MREIKFRAWFAKAKAVVPVDNLNLMRGPGHIEVKARHDFEKGGWYTPLREYTHKKTSTSPSTEQVPRIILMQYTGLKNKDGVEIYEGDIINYFINELYEEREETREVGFAHGAFWLYSEKGDELLYDVSNHDDEMEIVGNIYENPELLEAN